MTNKYREERWNNLSKYKKEVLKVDTIDVFRGKEYKHFLTGESKMKTFDKDIGEIKVEGNQCTLPNGNKITLQSYWTHMNSSQVMCINFFLKLCNDHDTIDKILQQCKLLNGRQIKGKAEKIIFEDQKSANDGTNIDLTIELDNKKKVFIEVKYTESSFGCASYHVKKKNPEFYKNNKNDKHNNVVVDQDNYEKYYQFVRNIYLGRDGDYSIFLFPRGNESIDKQYNTCINGNIIKNIKDYNVGKLYWEDVIECCPFDDFRKKYFGTDDDWK